MYDKRKSDSFALCSGTNENHRDVQERRIEVSCAVIEPSGLGERHANDLWAKRDERHCVWGREFRADSSGALRPVRSTAGDVGSRHTLTAASISSGRMARTFINESYVEQREQLSRHFGIAVSAGYRARLGR